VESRQGLKTRGSIADPSLEQNQPNTPEKAPEQAREQVSEQAPLNFILLLD